MSPVLPRIVAVCDCGATWHNHDAVHCLHCHLTFTSIRTHDLHRPHGHPCIRPQRMGLVPRFIHRTDVGGTHGFVAWGLRRGRPLAFQRPILLTSR